MIQLYVGGIKSCSVLFTNISLTISSIKENNLKNFRHNILTFVVLNVLIYGFYVIEKHDFNSEMALFNNS